MNLVEQIENEEYQKNLDKVDWDLPDMDKLEPYKPQLTRAILAGDIVDSIHCLGWALWPVKNNGYYDERWLRVVADFIEIQNKPFWDKYDAYCLAQEVEECEECGNINRECECVFDIFVDNP